MPFSAIEQRLWEGYQYSAEVAHDTLFGTFVCVLKSQDPDRQAEFDDLAQRFVDMINGSDHFLVSAGVKTYTAARYLTPTEPPE